MLILTADVGEGHVSAGRALQESLAAQADTTSILEDGLRLLGPTAQAIIRDGYRVQLRNAAWTYNLLYRSWRRLAPARWAIGRLLYRAGHRRLRALVAEREPDIIVTTHPALTVVLGRMRRRGELDAVLCATITDLVNDPTWCHRGIDLHVVMDPVAIPWVERHAGRGSVVAVRPLVAARFLAPRDVASARRALGLPVTGSVIVVSGGGWGVGRLADGMQAALAAGADRVIALAGRDDDVRAGLQAQWSDEPRVEILGFTEQMPELLHAATALVHGTGGVTSLEAVSCGCPLIAFGTRLAHVQEHNREMQLLGLCTVVRDPVELERALATQIAAAVAPVGTPVSWATTLDAGRAVVQAVRRVRPRPRWLRDLRRGAALAVCSAGVLWTVATDDAFSLVARSFDLQPVSHVEGRGRAIGLVIRAGAGSVAGLAGELSRVGIHVSFAVGRPLAPTAQRALRRAGDDTVALLPGAGAVRWLGTVDELQDLGGHGRSASRLLLVLPGRMSFGQYLLARGAGYRPLEPHAVSLRRLAGLRPAPGDLWLVSLTGPSTRAVQGLRAFVGRGSGGGVTSEPLGRLLTRSSSSRTAPTAPERLSSSVAAPRMATTHPTVTASPNAPRVSSGPAVTNGPSATGPTTWATNTAGATRVAGSCCSAVISASSPSPEAHAVATVQITAAPQAPRWAASATSCVDRPLQAKHRPASTGAARRTSGRRWTAIHSRPITSASPASTDSTITSPRGRSVGSGANAEIPTTEAAIRLTAVTSRRVTFSPSERPPTASSATSPTASAGWTTASGANSSATAWTGQPTSPSAVPNTHTGRRTSRVRSPALQAWVSGISRASIACSPTPAS